MSGTAAFWYLLGTMSGVAATVVLLPLTQGLPRRWWWTAGAAGTAAAAALAVYLVYGSPEWSAPSRRAVVTASPHGDGREGAAGSMAAAAERLAARLVAGTGSAADWDLLAQSYDTLGMADQARLAREQRIAATGTQPASRTATPGADASASAWADHADRLATTTRSLQGAPAAAIAEALKRDPDHPKALWLAASLALETQEHALALEQWQRLRRVLPADSPDIAIIDANLAETRALLAEGDGGRPAARPVADSATISGSVELDASLRALVRPGMTLFVFARASQTGGPPLAAVRLPASHWPMPFTLDDGAMMLPGTSLAGLDKVFVEARLSASGAAAAAPGDFAGDGRWVPTHGDPATLRLTRRLE
jgi:cytochrome c-type biogenesis protein CcmH